VAAQHEAPTDSRCYTAGSRLLRVNASLDAVPRLNLEERRLRRLSRRERVRPLLDILLLFHEAQATRVSVQVSRPGLGDRHEGGTLDAL